MSQASPQLRRPPAKAELPRPIGIGFGDGLGDDSKNKRDKDTAEFEAWHFKFYGVKTKIIYTP